MSPKKFTPLCHISTLAYWQSVKNIHKRTTAVTYWRMNQILIANSYAASIYGCTRQKSAREADALSDNQNAMVPVDLTSYVM
jgi:hypothetical protein